MYPLRTSQTKSLDEALGQVYHVRGIIQRDHRLCHFWLLVGFAYVVCRPTAAVQPQSVRYAVQVRQ